jgi:hypothetical protein
VLVLEEQQQEHAEDEIDAEVTADPGTDIGLSLVPKAVEGLTNIRDPE